MSVVQADGLPYRQHLEKLAYGTFPDIEALAEIEAQPQLPTLSGEVWAYFLALHKRRQFSEIGPLRFSWIDLYAWQKVCDLVLNEWQRELLCLIEDAYFSVREENKPK